MPKNHFVEKWLASEGIDPTTENATTTSRKSKRKTTSLHHTPPPHTSTTLTPYPSVTALFL
jgi:hypothetical protein